MIRRLIATFAMLAIAITAIYAMSAPRAEAQGMAVEPGTSGYDFSLMDTEGHNHHLADYFADGRTVVLEWYNPGCPFVKKYYEGGNDSMVDAKAFAEENGVVWLAVNSGAPGKQGHGLEANAQSATDWGIDNPILLDEDGSVGRMFGAQNTPQLFILSSEGVLLYNGGVDETKAAGETPQHNFVINALTQYMAGEEVNPASTAHVGCSVKYGEQKQAAEGGMQPQTAQGAR
ncbi:MAG: redoxin family protein [bacterium]